MGRVWLLALAMALACAAHAQQLAPNPKAKTRGPATLGAQPAPPAATSSDPSTTTTTTIITTTTTSRPGAGAANPDSRSDPGRDRLIQDSQRIADDVRRGDNAAAAQDRKQMNDDIKQRIEDLRNGAQQQ